MRFRHDALALLTADHARICVLFDRFIQSHTQHEAAARALEEACCALEVHAQIEQEIFYPAVRHEIACADWLEEGEVEHRTLDVLLEDLRSVQPHEPRAIATATVLAELLRRHLAKEERRIFPQVLRAGVDLVGLAELLRGRRQDIIGQRPAPLNGFAGVRAGRARLNGYSRFAPF
jgi:hypothetical protein